MTIYIETEEEYREKELAWFKVFDLCLDLGMGVQNSDSSVNNVLNFIKDLTKHKPQ